MIKYALARIRGALLGRNELAELIALNEALQSKSDSIRDMRSIVRRRIDVLIGRL